MPTVKQLTNARMAKKDEFYTSWSDIEKEIMSYIAYNPILFLDKTILLPTDSPFTSNFFKFFFVHFKDFGIKQLIATGINKDSEEYSYMAKVTKDVFNSTCEDVVSVPDVDKVLSIEKDKLKTTKTSRLLSYIKKDGQYPAGDFRSSLITSIRDEADFVITNPPFSLFREFFDWVGPLKRKFLVMATINACTYNNVFPYIERNELWLGKTIHSGDREFRVPSNYPINTKNYRVDSKGVVFIRVTGVRWLTNIEYGNHYQLLSLMTWDENVKHSKHKQVRSIGYEHYSNYDAIEVPYTDAIPSDYKGVMAVPITFLDKYDPSRFEFVSFKKDSKGNIVESPNTVGSNMIVRPFGVPEVNGRYPYRRLSIRNK